MSEYPKEYFYTTVKINKSKERVLIITDKVNSKNLSNSGLFYYFAKNGFVYPIGYLKSDIPFISSKNYIYLKNGNEKIKIFISDKNFKFVRKKFLKDEKNLSEIEFVTIKSADKFAGDFGSPAGNDIKKVIIDGFYFEYHKPQYKREYISNLMKECINDGVKTQVQMYSCVVNKLHP